MVPVEILHPLDAGEGFLETGRLAVQEIVFLEAPDFQDVGE
jgi:hypothetical protein